MPVKGYYSDRLLALPETWILGRSAGPKIQTGPQNRPTKPAQFLWKNRPLGLMGRLGRSLEHITPLALTTTRTRATPTRSDPTSLRPDGWTEMELDILSSMRYLRDMTNKTDHGMVRTLKATFEASGLSMKAVADGTGLPYAAVWKAVQGKSDPQLSTVAKIADLLGLELRPVRRAKKKRLDGVWHDVHKAVCSASPRDATVARSKRGSIARSTVTPAANCATTFWYSRTVSA